MSQIQPRHEQHQQLSIQVAKTTTAVTVGGSLMVLSGLTLAATVIGLVMVTPLLVIFSPVLVPAAITIFMILGGLLAAGGFGATATFVFYWMYRFENSNLGATSVGYRPESSLWLRVGEKYQIHSNVAPTEFAQKEHELKTSTVRLPIVKQLHFQGKLALTYALTIDKQEMERSTSVKGCRTSVSLGFIQQELKPKDLTQGMEWKWLLVKT
ncbi:hypothetical protein K7X08_029210 [Anisodus acutangulus]|uniref:Oleosin n=1 Tax=Anisodus acutangulus TaxID=402998 RepID=A0A9Q1L3X3_9SOLA|nr:hypothetical protein K7X08_029210 [Anisodus acutangulus]